MNLPILVLENILLQINGQDLCKTCCLVCKNWLHLIELNSFWIKKCIKEKKLNNKLKHNLDKKFKKWKAKELYFNKLYVTANLLKNPNGKEMLKHWWIGRDRFNHSFNSASYYFPKNLNYGFSFNVKDTIDNYKRFKSDDSETTNKWAVYMCLDKELACYNKKNGIYENFSFVTQYSLGEKIQVIDLKEEMNTDFYFDDCGIDIEENRLKLEITEYFSARNTFKYIYFLRVYLVSSNYEIVDSFKFEYVCRNDAKPLEWKKVIHRFNFDKTKIRFICYYHSGQVNIFCFSVIFLLFNLVST